MNPTVRILKSFGRNSGEPRFAGKGQTLTLALDEARALHREGLCSEPVLVVESESATVAPRDASGLSAVEKQITEHEAALVRVGDELARTIARVDALRVAEVDDKKPEAIHDAMRELAAAERSVEKLGQRRDSLAREIRDLTLRRAHLVYPIHRAAVARLADELGPAARKFVQATRESVARLLDEQRQANEAARLIGSPSDVRALDAQSVLAEALAKALYAVDTAGFGGSTKSGFR